MALSCCHGDVVNSQSVKFLFVFIVIECLHLHVSNTMPSLPSTAHLSTFPRGTQVKTVDSGILFTCTLSGYTQRPNARAIDMYWTGPGMVRVTATRGRVYAERSDEYNVRLYITKITESDAGLYTCNAEIPADLADSYRSANTAILHSEDVKLFLYEDIHFVDTPRVERQHAGGSALLQCVATGQPAPELSWRFNRRRIIPGNDKYILEEQGLRVNRLDVGDNGTYECRAEVESHGNVRVRHVDLDVLYPPTIVDRPLADRVIKGQEAVLRCRADANPPATYEWFREQRITEMVRVKVRLAQGVDSYVISDVKTSDEGRYFCRATNAIGSREVPVDVRMMIVPEIQSLPQHIVKAEGSTLTLPCESSGVPQPRISWGRADGAENYTDDGQLSEMAKSGILSVHSDSTGQVSSLIIRDVRRSYAGRFSCTARNAAGNDVRTVSLVVEYPPSLTVSNVDLLGWAGTNLNVTCHAAGLPVPSMNWFRGETYLTDSDTYRITTSRSVDTVTSVLSIMIHEGRSWVYGSYSCIAKNIHGYVTETAVVNEAFPPDIPRNVSIVQQTANTVTLSAVLPLKTGGLPVTTWAVHYESDVISRVSKTFTYGQVIHVTDLVPGTTYTFSLAAGNAVGNGPSVKFRVTLPAEPKPSPVVVREMSDVPQLTDSHNVNVNDNNYYQHVNHNEPTNPREDSVAREVSAEKLGHVNVVEHDAANGGPTGGMSTGLIITVGTAGALFALLLVAIAVAFCGILRRRRRRSATLYKNRSGVGGSGLGVPVENYALVHTAPSIRRHRQPGDPLPPPESADDDVIIVAPTPAVGRTDSEQHKAWERMISFTHVANDANGVDEIEFYEDDAGSRGDVIAVAKYTPRGNRTMPRVRLDDVLYRSGDAVDDVIERIECGGGSLTGSRTMSQLFATMAATPRVVGGGTSLR